MKKCVILFLIFVAVLAVAASMGKSSEPMQEIAELEQQKPKHIE